MTMFPYLLALPFGIATIWQRTLNMRRGSEKRESRPEPGQRIHSLFGQLAPLPLAVYVLKPDLLRYWDYFVPAWLKLAGSVILLISVLLWLWSQGVLGQNWSGEIAVRKGHTLTTGGPYRWVRHPMYTAFILGAIGLPLLVPNILASFPLVLHVIFTVSRAGREEALMEELFGNEFRTWRSKTGWFLPRFPRLRQPR